MSKILNMLMSTSNKDNLHILFTGHEPPDKAMIDSGHEFYIVEYSPMFDKEKKQENIHILKDGKISTSIGFDIVIVQDFLEATLKMQAQIMKALGLPTIRLYKNPAPTNVSPQEKEIMSEFSGDVCVFYDFMNYQNWTINKSSKVEILSDESADEWNKIFQESRRG